MTIEERIEKLEMDGQGSNLYEAILGEKNHIYYLVKFEQFDQQGPGLNASWNWPAFFFGASWALYRKMYKWFFVLSGIFLFSYILGKTYYSWFGALVSFASWIAFPIFANSLYHESVKKKIAIAQLTIKDESRLTEFLRYKGGVHTWVIWVLGLFLILFVIGILASILIPKFFSYQ